MQQLTGKVAIVTGASKGIGAGIARALGAKGASVVVNYATDKDGADKVVAAIKASGSEAIAVKGDVSDAAAVKALFAATKDAYGRLDVLVNNAAVFQLEPLEAVTEEAFHWHFNVNVLGMILAIQEAIPYFDEAGGSIINIGSIASVKPPHGSLLYSATKGAADIVTKVLAQELGTRNIRVNTLAPGGTLTEGVTRIGITGSEAEQRMIDNTPLGRIGQPDDIAKVAAFLASEDAGWITGDRIVASGGLW